VNLRWYEIKVCALKTQFCILPIGAKKKKKTICKKQLCMTNVFTSCYFRVNTSIIQLHMVSKLKTATLCAGTDVT